MAILVRSSEGDIQTNTTTPELDSPATITVDDLIAAIIYTNEDTTGTITPPSGFTERYDQEDVGHDSRDYLATKTAVTADNTNQGTANHYDFSGYGSTDDHAFGCISIYDSVGATTPIWSASARSEEATGGSSTVAPSTTITQDDSLVITVWSARNGTDYFNLDSSNSITNGGVDTKLNGGWVNDGFSGTQIVVYAHEVDISDSPFQPTLNYDSITADGLGQACVAHLFELDSTGSASGMFGLGPSLINGGIA